MDKSFHKQGKIRKPKGHSIHAETIVECAQQLSNKPVKESLHPSHPNRFGHIYTLLNSMCSFRIKSFTRLNWMDDSILRHWYIIHFFHLIVVYSFPSKSKSISNRLHFRFSIWLSICLFIKITIPIKHLTPTYSPFSLFLFTHWCVGPTHHLALGKPVWLVGLPSQIWLERKSIWRVEWLSKLAMLVLSSKNLVCQIIWLGSNPTFYP